MADMALSAVPSQPLSEGERVLDTFVAPAALFQDVRRKASWWLPFLLLVLGGYLLTFAIQQKVGWSQLVENQIRSNPKLSERMANLSPEQVAAQHKTIQYSMMGSFYGLPVIDLALYSFIAVILWPTINFGFGGSASYGRVLAVCVYAGLPGMLKAVLAAVVLFAGRSAEGFTAEGMLGSSVGYYIDTPGPLKTFCNSLDVFTIWTVVLMGLGLGIVANTKRSAGFAAVFGWWVLIVLVHTGWAAVQS